MLKHTGDSKRLKVNLITKKVKDGTEKTRV